MRNHATCVLTRYVAIYDFIKDMQKLEKVTSGLSEHKGYAIIITNDQAYWNPGKKMNPVDKAFHIHNGAEITGTLSWGEEASEGTRKNREADLFLNQSYRPSWRPYLSLDVEKNGEVQV
ncbi:hypothetical protein SAMN05216179_1910 [Gracilibacillus kekensis]|uniref:Uncharacterized protein n=2 Tax=Gracilibacillus kekensis TaxID=1027249 RepID=A0A1M7P1Y6_9BACI|nr:hypothetical protein SAMN05216179_1910 [Gracilibacillus kekensis]